MTSTTAEAGWRLEKDRRPLVMGVAGAVLAALVAIWPPATATGFSARVGLGSWLLLATSIAVIDAREHRIPNSLVGCLSTFTLAGVVTASAFTGDGVSAFSTVAWATVAVGVALGLHVASAGALGMGDVKLLLPVAVLLGWFGSEAVWTALLVTPVLASLFVGYRSIVRMAQDPVPLAPFVVAGVVAALLAL